MKSDFHGYYQPTEAEFDALWKDATIVVDANVLLNLYTYSSSTADEVLALLGQFPERLWIPHQVAYEYHKNRCGIIYKESKQYEEFTTNLKGVDKALLATKRHPFIPDTLAEKFREVMSEIKTSLEADKKQLLDLITKDSFRDKIENLFDGRVGEATKTEELKSIYKEGATRYAHRVPPGYSDAKKPEPEKYGDLVLWRQLIAYATSNAKPVIFVTDDQKNDWWVSRGRDKLGPRPELRQEFRDQADQDIYIYDTDHFVKTAKNRGNKLSDLAANEVEKSAKEREKHAASSLLFALYSQENIIADRRRQGQNELLKQYQMQVNQDQMQAENLKKFMCDPMEQYRKRYKEMQRSLLDSNPTLFGQRQPMPGEPASDDDDNDNN